MLSKLRRTMKFLIVQDEENRKVSWWINLNREIFWRATRKNKRNKNVWKKILSKNYRHQKNIDFNSIMWYFA